MKESFKIWKVTAVYDTEPGTVVYGRPTVLKADMRPLVRRLKLSGFKIFIAEINLDGSSTGLSCPEASFDWEETNV